MEDRTTLVISSYHVPHCERGKVYWPDVLGINLSSKRILDVCATLVHNLGNTDAVCQLLSAADESGDFLEEFAESNFVMSDGKSWESLAITAQRKNSELRVQIFEVNVENQDMTVTIDRRLGKGYEQLLNCINELKISEEELCTDDKFHLKSEFLDDHQIQESKLESPFYYSSQKIATDLLIERIKFILSNCYNHPKGKEFSAYTDFDFQIYTARSNMLETQTIQRLCHRQSGCFPSEMYADPKKLGDWAKERVRKYISTKAEEHLKELKDKITNNRETFFLIVADEAHWGITNSNGSSTVGTNSKFTNAWDDRNYPNVMVLLISATPWNLLTSSSRIPETFVARHKQSGEMVIVEERQRQHLNDVSGNEVMNDVGPKNELHVVHWTEIYEKQLTEGLLVSLKIPLKDKKDESQWLWLYRDDTDGSKAAEGINLYKWKGSSSETSKCLFLFQKTTDNGQETTTGIEIYSACKTYMLVSSRQRMGNVGFVRTEELKKCRSAYCSTFEMMFNFGEDVFEIRSSPDCYLKFNSNESCVILGRAPGDDIGLNALGSPSHSLDYLFIIESKQKPDDISPGKQYVSLNFYYNSMRNAERSKQLIREDELFQKMKSKCKIDYDSLLAIDYAYYILLIGINNADQAKVSAHSLAEFFGSPKSPEKFCREYLDIKKEKMEKFMEELKAAQNVSEDIPKPISCEKFQLVCDYLDDVCYKKLKSYALKVSRLKNITSEHSEDLAYLLIKYIFHAKCESFNENIRYIFDLLISDGQTIKLELISRNLERPFSELFLDCKVDILSDSETFLIVHDLIQVCKSNSGICGKMKVVRVSKKTSGNLFYATVVAARKVVQEMEHFEVIRYFDKLKLDNKFNTESIHRIWQILQRKHCEFHDKRTHRRCTCVEYKPSEPSLIVCKTCHHKHSVINQFSDLDRLPCILILVDKGRLGDTFPPSFNTMDLRVCHNTRAPSLASVMQELGRLCRYDVKSDFKNLPYALVGQEVMKRLKISLRKSALFTNSFKKIDIHAKKRKNTKNSDSLSANQTSMRPQIEASRSNYDHGNESKFTNRLLLQAEPQIGKTGVFLKTISVLRRMICKKDEVSETKEPEFDLVSDSDVSGSDSDDEIQNEDWQYPYWDDMKKGKKLKDRIESSKYSPFYGPYVHNEVPQYMQLSAQKKKSLPSVSDRYKCDDSSKDRFRAFSFQEHNHTGDCVECRSSDDFIVKEIKVKGQTIKISVPLINRFAPLMEKLNKFSSRASEVELSQNLTASVGATCDDDDSTLDTWIFNPSYGRSEKATVNYTHTMVKKLQDESYKKCQYVQILVVRGEEFDAYSMLWQRTHALLELPSVFEGSAVDVDMGGIGFARLFIQCFAEEFGLSRIFVLDDNIYKMHRLIPDKTQLGQGLAAADLCKSRILIEVPIFEALKHLELQFICASAPKLEFVHCTDFCRCECTAVTGKDLHQYTGPSETYGVLGVLRLRPNVKSVKCGFRKTHVCSLVLLNIEILKKNKIYYKPWQVHEDLNLNNDCDDKKLIVCKYNQYLMSKKQMKTWIPEIYKWPDDVILSLNSELNEAEGSGECVLRWIRAVASPKYLSFIIVHGNGNSEMVQSKHFSDKLSDQPGMRTVFTGLLKARLGKCHVVGFMSGENSHTHSDGCQSIHNYFQFTRGIGGFSRHLVIFPVEFCANLSLTTLKSFKALFGRLFHDEAVMNVFTSHSIQHFRNTFLAVLIDGSLKFALDDKEYRNCGIDIESTFNHLKRLAANADFEKLSKISRGEDQMLLTENETSSFNPSDLDNFESENLFDSEMSGIEAEVEKNGDVLNADGKSMSEELDDVIVIDDDEEEEETNLQVSNSSRTLEGAMENPSLELHHVFENGTVIDAPASENLFDSNESEAEAHFAAKDVTLGLEGNLELNDLVQPLMLIDEERKKQTDTQESDLPQVFRISSDLERIGLVSHEQNSEAPGVASSVTDEEGSEWDIGITDEELILFMDEFEKQYYASASRESPTPHDEIILLSSDSGDFEPLDSYSTVYDRDSQLSAYNDGEELPDMSGNYDEDDNENPYLSWSLLSSRSTDSSNRDSMSEIVALDVQPDDLEVYNASFVLDQRR